MDKARIISEEQINETPLIENSFSDGNGGVFLEKDMDVSSLLEAQRDSDHKYYMKHIQELEGTLSVIITALRTLNESIKQELKSKYGEK